MWKAIPCLAAVFLIASLAPATALADTGEEAAIRKAVETIEEGWNAKSGKQLASVFAEEHDYVIVDGRFMPGFTREANAAAHQGLFDGVHKETDIQLDLAKVRFLTPDLAVAHAKGFSHARGDQTAVRQHVIMTLVLKKQEDGWRIVAFHNSPRQERPSGKAE